jgi:hypothetical protein
MRCIGPPSKQDNPASIPTAATETDIVHAEIRSPEAP